MFCYKCGAQIADGSKFCPSCGARTDGASTAPQPGQNQVGGGSAYASYQQPTQPAGGYAQPPVPGGYYGTVDNSRSLAMWIVLTIVTCGIYGYYFTYKLAQDLNTMCEGDGESTPGLLAFILLSLVTCGFYSYYWYYKIGNRLQANAPRYGLVFQENGTTILLWQFIGALLCFIGPFVAMHIIIKNTNALATAYNARVLGR